MHLIFFRYDEENDEYTPTQSGQDIVPTGIVDKVLPVSENVSRQFEKVYYKDEKLMVREGMKLLSDNELNQSDLESISDMDIPFEMKNNEIVEVEF